MHFERRVIQNDLIDWWTPIVPGQYKSLVINVVFLEVISTFNWMV
jgi:hypothetical protein